VTIGDADGSGLAGSLTRGAGRRAGIWGSREFGAWGTGNLGEINARTGGHHLAPRNRR